MYSRCVLLMCLLLAPSLASATCVILDIALWSQEERAFLFHVTATAAPDAPIALTFPTNASIEVCSEAPDVLALDPASLHAAATAIVAEQTAIATARDTAVAEARAEVGGNTFCNASLALIVTRIDVEKAAIQADIDAITTLAQARAAMTVSNNRSWAAVKFLARCVKGRATLGGE